MPLDPVPAVTATPDGPTLVSALSAVAMLLSSVASVAVHAIAPVTC